MDSPPGTHSRLLWLDSVDAELPSVWEDMESIGIPGLFWYISI